MTTDRDFPAEIEAQLETLNHLPSRRWQRDKTILALAAAAVDGRSVNDVLGRDGVIAKPTYYRRGAPWYHDPDFRRALTAVTDLKRKQDAAIRATADEAARRKRHERRAKILETAVDRLETMLSNIDTGGADDFLPPTAVAQFMRVVLAEQRAEFGDTEPIVAAVVDDVADVNAVRAGIQAKLDSMRAARVDAILERARERMTAAERDETGE